MVMRPLIYISESPCTALKVIRSSLNLNLWVTGSQCSCFSSGACYITELTFFENESSGSILYPLDFTEQVGMLAVHTLGCYSSRSYWSQRNGRSPQVDKGK